MRKFTQLFIYDQDNVSFSAKVPEMKGLRELLGHAIEWLAQPFRRK